MVNAVESQTQSQRFMKGGSLDKSSRPDDGYFEPDEDELEEERRNAAAGLIQKIFRAKRARQTTRELVKADFVKEFDPLLGAHVYKNRRTGVVSRRKSVFLGSSDLETQRSYARPEGYDPGKSTLPQFALFITNSLFESPKIPDLPAQVERDHDALREVLEHPHFGKFESGNCFFVKNASSEVFKATLASVAAQVSATMSGLERAARRRSRGDRGAREAKAGERQAGGERLTPPGEQRSTDAGARQDSSEADGEGDAFDPTEALLLVSICTHGAEITKGKELAGGYFVTTNSSWKSKDGFARTSVRLDAFCEVIAAIQVRHKVLLLDIAHTEKVHGSFKKRHLYPPRDFYDRAARLCGAVVVGSCRIGTTGEIDFDAVRREADKAWNSTADKAETSDGTEREDEVDRGNSNSNTISNGTVDIEGQGGGAHANVAQDHCGRSHRGGVATREMNRPEPSAFSGTGASFRDGAILVKERVRVLEGVWRRRRRQGARALRIPVYERAGYEGEKSVFGRLVREALIGRCIRGEHRQRILLADFYEFLRVEFRRLRSPGNDDSLGVRTKGESLGQSGHATSEIISESKARRRGQPSDGAEHDSPVGTVNRNPEDTQVAADENELPRRSQVEAPRVDDLGLTPRVAEMKRLEKTEKDERIHLGVLFTLFHRPMRADNRSKSVPVVVNLSRMPVLAGADIFMIARSTLCAGPSPPPSPLAPVPIEIGHTIVRLELKMPSFDGSPATSFELQSCGDLRNNRDWAPVFPQSYPPVTSRTIKLPRRVPGLNLRYRVRAFNAGGWGDFGPASDLVSTPAWLFQSAEDATMLMKKLAWTGGARLVLSRMKRYPSSLSTQEDGFHHLVGEINKGSGLPRDSLAQEVAEVVAHAMEVYSQVPSIQRSGLLLLGWAARGKGEGTPLDANIIQRCLFLVATAKKLHATDDAVANHASWAASNLRLVNRGDTMGAKAKEDHHSSDSSQ